MENHSEPLETRVGAQLRLPVQAVPIDRTMAGSAALAANAGMDASAPWWQTAIDIGSKLPWKDILSWF
jgi:hypothetical protein